MSVVSTDSALTPGPVARPALAIHDTPRMPDPQVTRSPSYLALRAAILATFEPELVLCCKVAVLTAAGYRRTEIIRKLGESPTAIQKAQDRVKRAAERLDHGD